MSAAEDLVWALAAAVERVPATLDFSDAEEPARSWLRAWAATSRDGCPHDDGETILWALGGARRALCWSCATEAGLSALALCSRCLTPADEGAITAIFAHGANTIVIASVCSRCRTNTERNTTS